MKKFIGAGMIASLFGALFVAVLVTSGPMLAFGVFAATALVVGWVAIAVHLMG